MPLRRLLDYLGRLPAAKVALWCYLLWYLNTVAHHFDTTPAIWWNALGISVVIGIALCLSVGRGIIDNPDRWPLFRLFAMPFGVLSFSSLIKGQGFVLIVPPDARELVSSIGLCAGFVLLVVALRRVRGSTAE